MAVEPKLGVVTLRATGRLALTLVAVLFVVLAIIVATTFREVSEARSRLVEQLYPADNDIAEALVSSADMERSLLTYARDAEEGTLTPFVLGRAYSGASLDRLGARLTGDLASLRPIYEEAVAERADWLDDAADPLIAAVTTGDSATVTRLTTPAGGPERYAFGKLRTDLRLIQYQLGKLTVQDTAVVTAANRRLAQALALAALVALALAIGGQVLLHRRVLGPLADLGGQMRHLAGEQDTATPLTPSGPAELAAVGRDAERLRQHLAAQIDTARQARESLIDEQPLVAALGDYLQGSADRARLPGFGVGVAAVTAAGVLSGDWWEARAAGAGEAQLILADTRGHDVRAGALSVMFKAALTASLDAGLDPGAALANAARVFDEAPDCFVSCVMLAAAPKGLRYLNAGHSPPLLVRAGGTGTAPGPSGAARRPVDELAPTGPIVSAIGGGWTTLEVPLAPGDAVVLFTDGLVEAREASGDELGSGPVTGWSQDLLQQCAADTPTERAQYLAAGILDRARAAAPNLRRDDVTVIVAVRE